MVKLNYLFFITYVFCMSLPEQDIITKKQVYKIYKNNI